MFKKYKVELESEYGGKVPIYFFVHSKPRRSGGFMHRACVIGIIPRLDKNSTDLSRYRKNDERLMSCRVHKVSYSNRTWECWAGQTCLSGLWNKIAALKFVDAERLGKVNPFATDDEPIHEELYEPDELFSRFRRT